MLTPSVFIEGDKQTIDLKAKYQKRGTNPDRVKAIRTFAGDKVLDVGCGSGAYVLSLANQKDIYGVDYQTFDSWAERPERFKVAMGDELPYANDSFDTLLSFETLEHLPDPMKALREYYRVTRDNLILTVPNCTITPAMKRSNMLYSHWEDRTHVQFFTLDSIRAHVEAAGFRVREARYINQINLMPLFLEWFQLKNPTAVKWATKLAKRYAKRAHHITCLVVGEKHAIQ